MVATTFAADTPLASRARGENGIAALDLVELRVRRRPDGVPVRAPVASRRHPHRRRVRGDPLLGKAAAFLRGFRAIYIGVFMNCVIMAWVNLAMGSILMGMFGIPRSTCSCTSDWRC